MATGTQSRLKRLQALMAKRHDSTIEILNPRTFDLPPEEWAQAEADNAERVRQAELAGHHIIKLKPLK